MFKLKIDHLKVIFNYLVKLFHLSWFHLSLFEGCLLTLTVPHTYCTHTHTHTLCLCLFVPSVDDASCEFVLGWETRAACAVQQHEVVMVNGTIKVPDTGANFSLGALYHR